MIDSHASGLGAKVFMEKLNTVDVMRKKTPDTRITKNGEIFFLSMRQLQIEIINFNRKIITYERIELFYAYSSITVSAAILCPTISHIVFCPPTWSCKLTKKSGNQSNVPCAIEKIKNMINDSFQVVFRWGWMNIGFVWSHSKLEMPMKPLALLTLFPNESCAISFTAKL